jgi:hypothetical protein
MRVLEAMLGLSGQNRQKLTICIALQLRTLCSKLSLEEQANNNHECEWSQYHAVPIPWCDFLIGI